MEGVFIWTHLNGWGGFEACFTVVSFAVMKDMVSEISREACKFRINDNKSQIITFRVPWPWYKTCECYHLPADHSVETVCEASFSTLGNFKHIFRLQSACQCSYLPLLWIKIIMMIINLISITSTLIIGAIKKNDFMMLMMQPVKQKVLHWQPLEGLPGW